jgi:GNAT superfamily N-acetyltransferase
MPKNEDNEFREGCLSYLEDLLDAILIREASEGDLPAILGLYSQFGMEEGSDLSWNDAKKIFARMKTYPDYTLYVATFGDTVVGSFALLIMDNLGHRGAPSGVVEDFIVHQDWRGKGIGRTMMKEAMTLCAVKGCRNLTLTSNKLRHNAHIFYKALGFDVQGFSYSVPIELSSLAAGLCYEADRGASS